MAGMIYESWREERGWFQIRFDLIGETTQLLFYQEQ